MWLQYGVRSCAAQARRSRRVCTHLFHEDFDANPATNASVFISRPSAAVSHVPQLRKSGKPCFHRHRRARGLVRIFTRSHGCAQVLRKRSQIMSRV